MTWKSDLFQTAPWFLTFLSVLVPPASLALPAPVASQLPEASLPDPAAAAIEATPPLSRLWLFLRLVVSTLSWVNGTPMVNPKSSGPSFQVPVNGLQELPETWLLLMSGPCVNGVAKGIPGFRHPRWPPMLPQFVGQNLSCHGEAAATPPVSSVSMPCVFTVGPEMSRIVF